MTFIALLQPLLVFKSKNTLSKNVQKKFADKLFDATLWLCQNGSKIFGWISISNLNTSFVDIRPFLEIANNIFAWSVGFLWSISSLSDYLSFARLSLSEFWRPEISSWWWKKEISGFKSKYLFLVTFYNLNPVILWKFAWWNLNIYWFFCQVIEICLIVQVMIPSWWDGIYLRNWNQDFILWLNFKILRILSLFTEEEWNILFGLKFICQASFETSMQK